MSQHSGFFNNSNLVCRLNKVIYGLKQDPRSWFLKLSTTLYSLCFHFAKSDTSLFIRFQNDITLLVLIYVDDIIITSSNLHVIQHLIHILHINYALKDLDPLHFLFLGIEASWTLEGALHLYQTKYIHDLLSNVDMLRAKPQQTPKISTSRLSKDGSSLVFDPTTYRVIVGALQYITLTHPEISYSVNKVCQYMQAP